MKHQKEAYMQRAIDLARKGLGHTAPNPLVGAVIVCNNRIIGEGYHQQYGQPHAEVNAINSVLPADRPLLQSSTLYVTLEPCSHYGKTPPCADLIIKNKIPKVIIGSKDWNPKVSGAGMQKLRRAGIRVITGIKEKECVTLNKRFFTYLQKKRPYIILKWAQSEDHYIALPGPRPVKITSPMTDRIVHRWRSEEQAILIGARTAKIDNPQLTNRLWTGNSPLRIVLDQNDTLPEELLLLNDQNETLIYTQNRAEKRAYSEWIKINSQKNFLAKVLEDLYRRKILSVFVEGGAQILKTFLVHDLWEECRIIKGKMALKDGLRAPQLEAVPGTLEKIEGDLISYYQHS